jgi:2-keto-4-pentenoate hydratase
MAIQLFALDWSCCARRLMRAIALAASISLTSCTTAGRNAESAIVAAWRDGMALPPPHLIDETLTIETAYQVQRRLVRKWRQQPAGFKGGLTSPAAQQRFGTDTPVAGVLPAAGLKPSGSTLSLRELAGLNIETEVAFKLGRPIERRVRDIAELQTYVAGIAPAVELPRLQFTDISQVTAVDLIATNVGAAAYILGTFEPPAKRDPNSVATRLVCNERELFVGAARDALGDQWQAALWLVNRVIDSGWTLQRDQVLLTGALGRMVPAQPGACTASFGDWGTIGITIVP